MTSHNLSAAPGTDIWRKPPHTNVYNAPTTPLSHGPLPTFLSARASFSFPYSQQYDQAGLLLTFQPLSSPLSPPPKWIKTGIEFYNGKPMLSTVATDRWADWSVTPLPTASEAPASEQWTTISIEKGGDEHGTSLWVYHILDDETKIPLREICWVYGDNPETWEIGVEIMAARPSKEGGDLSVRVEGAEVKWSQ